MLLDDDQHLATGTDDAAPVEYKPSFLNRGHES
jgi:hypothetical protein